MTIMARIFLGTIIIVIVISSFFKIIAFTNFLIILALCWGFIGVIESIEELGRKKGE